MNPADLIALAKRVEREQPNRELDRDVILALYPDAQVGEYCVGDEEWLVFHAEPMVRNKTKLPAFTSSLDAAMTLVPEDGRFQVGRFNLDPAKCSAQVGVVGEISTPEHGSLGPGLKIRAQAVAAEPALALTAACLRALAAQVRP